MGHSTQNLATQLVTLTPTTSDDKAFLSRLITDDRVRAYLGGAIAKADIARALGGYIRPNADAHIWTIRETRTKAPVGVISLTQHKDGADHELSYQLMPEAWQQGFATAAGTAVLAFAKETCGLPRVIAETQMANTRSIALLHRLRFTQIKTIERFGHPQGIFSTEFPALKPAP